MSVTIEMPKLSDTMSVGTVVKWHKNVGDEVSNGDTLAEIETDKATMELENFEDGVLLKILVGEGEEAPIGSPLAYVGEKGEELEIEEAPSSTKPEDTTPSDSESEENEDAQSLAEKPANTSNDEDVPPKEEVAEHPNDINKSTSSAPNERVRISPLARKIAIEKNVDVSQIKGSGPSGRIVKKDVLGTEVSEQIVDASQSEIKTAHTPTFAAKENSSIPKGLLKSKSVPLSGMRSVIAKRLSESKSTIPHFYLQKEINIKPLLDTRLALNESAKKQATLSNLEFNKISVNDLILKACAESIKWHPEINTSWGEGEIIFYDSVELAFGVAIDGGLLTPVIRNADSLSLTEISHEAKNLISLARDKKLSPEAMAGSTFTVTNLGMYGIDFFSGIINPPNAAILSVGSSIKKPIVDKSGKIVAGETLTLGLSCDHRLVDGAIGASFLGSLANNLENPACMLV